MATVGLSRAILIALGTGYTSTLLFKDAKLSDVLATLQVKGFERKDLDVDSDDLAQQLRHLAKEVQRLAYDNRQVTVIGGDSGGNFTSIMVSAATLGALGYGYMWVKGIKFSDLMYVTRRGMASAVSNLTQHLQHLSDSLSKMKRGLTQRIEDLDRKLDDQMEISRSIRNEVTDVRGDVSQISIDLNEFQRRISGMDDKLLSLEQKQELANKGVMYLCSFVNGKSSKMPETIQEQLKLVGSSRSSLMGLKGIADCSALNGIKLIAGDMTQDNCSRC